MLVRGKFPIFLGEIPYFLAAARKTTNKFNFIESLPLSVKKMQAFLYFRLLRFAFSLALTSSFSFSLAVRIQANLILARSCVSCTIFNLLRSLKIGFNDLVVLLGADKPAVVAADAFIPRRRKKSKQVLFFLSACTIFNLCYNSLKIGCGSENYK